MVLLSFCALSYSEQYDSHDERDDDGEGESVEEHKSIIMHLLSQVRLGMDLTKVRLDTSLFLLHSLSMSCLYKHLIFSLRWFYLRSFWREGLCWKCMQTSLHILICLSGKVFCCFLLSQKCYVISTDWVYLLSFQFHVCPCVWLVKSHVGIISCFLLSTLSIAEQSDPRERMVQVVRWYLSAFHAGRKGSVAKKPYNPILGEVFYCHWDIPSETEEPASGVCFRWCEICI